MRRALFTIVSALTIVLGVSAPAMASGSPWSIQHRIRIAAARLSLRPALILPGQWEMPAGPVLVRECYQYKGSPSELLDCLTQPDPRLTDPRVMTFHQAHVLHVLHMRHACTYRYESAAWWADDRCTLPDPTP